MLIRDFARLNNLCFWVIFVISNFVWINFAQCLTENLLSSFVLAFTWCLQEFNLFIRWFFIFLQCGRRFVLSFKGILGVFKQGIVQGDVLLLMLLLIRFLLQILLVVTLRTWRVVLWVCIFAIPRLRGVYNAHCLF